MKLVHWELQQLLDEYVQAGPRKKSYELHGIKHWAGCLLAAGMDVTDPIGVRFFIGGFAIATPYYWPDMRRISVQHLLDMDAKLAGAYVHHYRRMITELYESTCRA